MVKKYNGKAKKTYSPKPRLKSSKPVAKPTRVSKTQKTQTRKVTRKSSKQPDATPPASSQPTPQPETKTKKKPKTRTKRTTTKLTTKKRATRKPRAETKAQKIEASDEPSEVRPKPLTPEQAGMVKFIGVPSKGPIPTLINWDSIPPDHYPPSEPDYQDYPHPGAPKGMLKLLRKGFEMNRVDQKKAPVNMLLVGPKGTGKTVVVRKFAEDAQLPYWGLQGENIPGWMLLGRVIMPEAGRTSFQEGIIPKAVRAGGILHLDEINVFDPEVLMRLDELLDNRRQINMVNETGEVIKAHPDLFIVATMNPPTYEGVKPLPDPIKSRFGLVVEMNPPSLDNEIAAIKKKFGMNDQDFAKYRRDVTSFISVAQKLRDDTSLSYTPTMRETISLVQNLKHGADFKTAVIRSLLSKYHYEEEKNRVIESFVALGRRELQSIS